MPSVAAHMATVPASGIRRIYEMTVGLDDIISLVVGEPDLPVAPHIVAAAKQAWDDGQTNYTPNAGIPQLRETIVSKLARTNNLSVDFEQVWATVGATQGLHQAMTLVLDPGDEILVPDPGYTTFTMSARMLNAVPVRYSLKPEHSFLPDIEELDRLVTARSRAIIINSPSNPLGVVFGESVLRELHGFAQRHDLWIISDEVYEYFCFSQPHLSIASFDTDDRVFTAFSLSKTYAMTGIRVGYLVTPPGLTPLMSRVQEASISCVSTPGQFAAIAAITGDQDDVAAAREHYRSNIKAATDLLDERGIRYLAPGGTFYLWVDVSHASNGDVAAWAERFLEQDRVAVAPGSAFGPSGEGWIRVCVAAPVATLIEGLGRLPSPVRTA